MLIHEKLPQGHIYPQLTQAPISSYADFLNFFRGGQTLDDNTHFTTDHTVHNAMFRTAIASGHLTKTKNMAIPNESLADVVLTTSGSELIQTVLDRKFCETAIAEARKSIAEDDDEPHPYVGAVIVKNGVALATGYRGEKGKGDHAEYCALRKMNEADLVGCTVYTTLEPCSTRKPPKTSCTNRLIIEIGFFPNDMMQELLALNKEWSDSLRVKPIVPPNDTSPLANVSYYKLGTSMQDNIHLFVRPPKEAGGFYTIEDASNNVLAHGRTLEEIAIEWQPN